MRRSTLSFSLLEVMVAVAILLVAIMGTIGAMAVSSNLRVSTKQNELATQAVQQVLEQYRTKTLPNVITDANAELAGAPLYGASDEKALGVGATRNVYVLSEKETRLLLPTDTTYDGTIDATDTYDLDGDGTADENNGASTRADYVTAVSTGDIVPILIRIQWGRQRPINGKPVLTAVHDTTPGANQVLGALDITREYYVEVVTFIYPTSTN